MRAMLGFVGACVLFASQGSPPAAPQNPPRDSRPSAREHNGAIVGRVTATDTHEPIRWATVSVNSPEQQITLSTSTNAEGRYRFEGLPPGTYMLRAAKAGFVTMPFGALRYRDPAAPIPLGATAMTADLELPRAGAIEGRLLSPLGDPLQDATVQALRIGYGAAGRRTVAIGRSSRTDDLGRFRVHSLPPGHYIVEAAPLSLAQLAERQERDVPTALRTYFPGTLRSTEAQLVHVSSARTSSISFSTVLGEGSTLAGTVVDSRGRSPQTATVVLIAPGGNSLGALNLSEARNAFGFSNVQPGEYLLFVAARADGSDAEFAVRRVTITGGIVREPEIQTMPGIGLEGAIEIESAGGAPLPAGLAVVAYSTAFPSLVADPNGPSRAARVGPDGRFTLSNLVGPRLFRVPLKAPWAVKDVRLDDRDVSDAAVDFSRAVDGTVRPPGARLLRLVLTDRTGSVSGSLPTPRVGSPFDPRTQVVVFPENEQRWGFESRFTKVADVDRDGRFAVHGLLPGRYLAVVVSDLEPGAWGDPEVLRELKSSAVSVTVAEGKDSAVAVTAGTPR